MHVLLHVPMPLSRLLHMRRPKSASRVALPTNNQHFHQIPYARWLMCPRLSCFSLLLSATTWRKHLVEASTFACHRYLTQAHAIVASQYNLHSTCTVLSFIFVPRHHSPYSSLILPDLTFFISNSFDLIIASRKLYKKAAQHPIKLLVPFLRPSLPSSVTLFLLFPTS